MLPQTESRHGFEDVQAFKLDDDDDENDIDDSYAQVWDDLSEYKVESPAVGEGLDDFKSLLGVVDSTWSTVKNIFSSSSKTAIVEKITNLGFSKLQSSCHVQMFKGVPQA